MADLTLEDLERILKLCHGTGVRRLQYRGADIFFHRADSLGLTEEKLKAAVKVAQEALAKEALDTRDTQMDEMLLESPAQYEQMLANEETVTTDARDQARNAES